MRGKGEAGPKASIGMRMRGTFRYTGRALGLVWQTSRRMTVALATFTLLAGLLPAATAWMGKLVVDGVLQAARSGTDADRNLVIGYVLIQGGLVMLLAGTQRGLTLCQNLLRLRLGHHIGTMILEKALTLRLEHFEDAELQNRLTQARQEASSRPLSLVSSSFTLIRHAIGLSVYLVLLLQFSGWAVLIVAVAGIPAFLVEARYSGKAYRLARSKITEVRERGYFEGLLTREGSAKEVIQFGLGRRFLQRYHELFGRLYDKDRRLQLRRGLWGFALGALGSAGLYGAYLWIALATIAGRLTVGEMTMYLVLFRQAQTAITASLAGIGTMYEDNLYLSNLYEFLEFEVPPYTGTATEGPDPADGLRFESVGFTYPGGKRPALRDVSFHAPRGSQLGLVGENGSGKTTLVKLLMRLHEPSSGRILLDGRDLREWDVGRLRRRVAAIFQDFVKYKLLAGENIGVGDVEALEDEERWAEAARLGTADEFIDRLPAGYHTRLGKGFLGGHELSGGQWQKIALARAFMRREADVLVLDEPTASMDPEAEAAVYDHARTMAAGRTVILISHRLSAVRDTDRILVLSDGRLVEEGTHDELLARDGRYAHLFRLQARAYEG